MKNPEDNNATRRLDRLEREIRWWRRGVAAAVLACAAMYLSDPLRPREAAAQAASPPADKAADASAIYGEVHTKAHRAIAMIDQTVKMGSPIYDPAGAIASWSFALLSTDMYRCSVKDGGPRTTDPEVYLAAARGPADPERLKAFREHLERMKLWEGHFRPLAEKRYITQIEFLAFQSRRLQAEGWLAREQSKPGK